MFGEIVDAILILTLIVNWAVQLVAIYRLPESHFRQVSDRLLWFMVVLVLFPVGGDLSSMESWPITPGP